MPEAIQNAKLQVLFSEEQISARIDELAAKLSTDYAGRDPLMICILKGSMPFFVDLTRAMTVPLRHDYLAVQSYEGTSSTGVVRFVADLSSSIEGQHVVIVEDIVDTGLTMSYLLHALGARGPASLKVATLLDKPSRRKQEVVIDYCGFSIPDQFVVGYGLDYEQYFRNLPYVAVLEEVPDLGGAR